MIFKLFLLFTIIPVAELALLIKVGQHLGVLDTVLIVLVTAMVGSILVKLEGLHVLFSIRERMAEGRIPGNELLEGVMILVAGALLLTPGLLTDAVGVLLVVPPSRRVIREIIKKYLRKKLKNATVEFRVGPPNDFPQ